jgi:flagellar M-ring protein FliF
MASLTQIAQRMSPRGWAMLGASAAAFILFIVVVMHIATAPSYTTVEAGIDPANTGKITATLATQGISYQLQNGGTAVAVNSSQAAQARVALAGAGELSANTQPGFSLLNNPSLGESSAQEEIQYERALEGQLAQTIDQIDGVSSAEVNLVIPDTQDELFSNTQQQATASVLLSDGGSLDAGSVRGIAELVHSSVPGLSLDNVTITDSTGTLLWPSSGDGAASGLPPAQAADQRYDDVEDAQVNGELAQMLGPDRATVMVNAQLNSNQASSDTLTYSGKAMPLQTQTSDETLKGANPTSVGAAGTASNIPAYTSTTGTSANSSYADKTANTTYGVDKTITHAVVAPGGLTRQSISVLVSSLLPPTDLTAIKQAVENDVGFSAKRGDQISIGRIPFAKPVTAPPAATPSAMLGYARYGVLAIASLLFLAFSGRKLRRREREPFAGQPTWLRELEAPRSLASLETPAQPSRPVEIAALRQPVNVAKKQIEELVQRDPERVAQQVRAWMAED